MDVQQDAIHHVIQAVRADAMEHVNMLVMDVSIHVIVPVKIHVKKAVDIQASR